VSKHDKLIQKIFRADADVTPNEAVKILKKLGFKATPTSGSHLTLRKSNRPSVTIVLTQNPVKSKKIKKLQETLTNEGYQND
jgi:predicted RNA binding protein YcfA (HicA-like mRNA interferase family)